MSSFGLVFGHKSDQAFAAWHDEVYATAVDAIRQEGLIDLFPERTEADLFMWSWQNSQALEDSATGEEPAESETPIDPAIDNS